MEQRFSIQKKKRIHIERENLLRFSVLNTCKHRIAVYASDRWHANAHTHTRTHEYSHFFGTTKKLALCVWLSTAQMLLLPFYYIAPHAKRNSIDQHSHTLANWNTFSVVSDTTSLQPLSNPNICVVIYTCTMRDRDRERTNAEHRTSSIGATTIKCAINASHTHVQLDERMGQATAVVLWEFSVVIRHRCSVLGAENTQWISHQSVCSPNRTK